MESSQTEVTNKIRGSCACGRVKFVAEPKTFETVYCYCTSCRKCSGNAFLPFTHFHVKDLHWETAPDEFRKSDFAVRGHCSTCGSSISMAYQKEPETLGIAVGCIDEGLEYVGKVPKCIFVEERPGWVELPSGVPHYIEFTPGFTGASG